MSTDGACVHCWAAEDNARWGKGTVGAVARTVQSIGVCKRCTSVHRYVLEVFTA